MVSGMTFGSGCRCCYDPNSDGGEYLALAEARERLRLEEVEEKKDEYFSTEETNDPPEDDDNVKDSDDDDSDDEFDYLLDEDLPGDSVELEERRRAELEFMMLRVEMAKLHGYGTHRQMHPRRVLKAAGLGGGGKTRLPNPPRFVVLHLMDPESSLSAELDLFLEKLALNYVGTKFFRSYGQNTLLLNPVLCKSVLPPRVLPDQDSMPCLVAIRDGTVVAVSIRLREVTTTDDMLVTHAVHSWLQMANVLEETPPAFDNICRIQPEEDALLDSMRIPQPQQKSSPLEEEEDDHFHCGVAGCFKKFYHEHVGIQTETQTGRVVAEEDVVGTSVSSGIPTETQSVAGVVAEDFEETN